MKQEHAFIAIEIENSTLAPFLDLEKGKASKKVHLTTMVDNQRRAFVKVFLVMPGKKVLLKEFDLTHLPPKPAGPPRFVLQCVYDGGYFLTVELQVDGKPFGSERISLKAYLRRRRFLPLLLAAAAAAALLAALLLLPRGCGRAAGTAEEQPVSRTAVSASRPVEKPETPTATPAPAPKPEPATPPPPPASEPEPAAPVPVNSETASEAAADPAVEKVSRELVIYFLPNDTSLTGEAERQLAGFADAISGWRSVSLTIEGHCALSGTGEGREELSRERAEKSAAFLVRTGAAAASSIRTAWYAGERPVTRDPDRQELNRRVEISARGEAEAPAR